MAAKAEDEVNIALAFKLYILNFLMGVSYCVSNFVLFSCSAYILTSMLLCCLLMSFICIFVGFFSFKILKEQRSVSWKRTRWMEHW